jgi:hypothetical protein
MPQGRFHQDQSGTKINMLTLLCRLPEQSKNSSYKYMTRCDCGTEKAIFYNQVKSGRAQSCGCLQKRKGKDAPAYKHGRSATKEYDLELHMKRNYGMSFKQYEEMLFSQDGVCAICKAEPPVNQHKTRLNIDHDHSTGKVRGLLCDCCNRALGLMRDNTDLLQKAIDYLMKYSLAR